LFFGIYVLSIPLAVVALIFCGFTNFLIQYE